MAEEISKKDKILNISREFFYTKGYGKTSIQNIIDKAEIAKGTFYHYFKSKEDLLNQFTSREVSGVYDLVYKTLDMDLNALEKLEMMFKFASNWKSENVKLMRALVRILISDVNIMLRHSMLQNQIKQMAPVYQSIINQGVKEGVFHVRDIEYTSQFILSTSASFGENAYKILGVPIYTEEVLNEFRNLMKNFEDSLERILGLKESSIHIIDDDVLEKLIKGLLEA